MPVAAFDHAAIPIGDVDAMLRFYAALGFEVQEVRPPLFYSVGFGANKINFHGPEAWRSPGFTLRGPAAKPGCGDFCFAWDGSADEPRRLCEQQMLRISAACVGFPRCRNMQTALAAPSPVFWPRARTCDLDRRPAMLLGREHAHGAKILGDHRGPW